MKILGICVKHEITFGPTEHEWCVQLRNGDPEDGFPSSIGELEVQWYGDDDVLILTNDCNQNACNERVGPDETFSECSFDSYYHSDFFMTNRDWSVYMCTANNPWYP